MEIRLKSKNFEFEINCFGKYNFIVGNSGSHKTHFVKAMQKYKSGVRQFSCNVKVDNDNISKSKIHVFLGGEDITDAVLQDIVHSVGHLYVVDEFSQLFSVNNIASIIRSSKSYFIFVTRRVMGWLPVSIDSIYKLNQNADGLIVNKPVYANCNIDMVSIREDIEYVLTEDSKSGRQFFMLAFPALEVCPKNAILNKKLLSRDNSQLHNFLLEDSTAYKSILVVFDASAYGYYYPFLREVIVSIKEYCKVSVISWDSFEAYLLEKDKIYVNKQATGCVFESVEQLATLKFQELYSYDKSRLPSSIKDKIDDYVYGVLSPLSKYKSCSDGFSSVENVTAF